MTAALPSGVLPPPTSKSSPVLLDNKHQVFLQVPKQEERILLNDIKVSECCFFWLNFFLFPKSSQKLPHENIPCMFETLSN